MKRVFKFSSVVLILLCLASVGIGFAVTYIFVVSNTVTGTGNEPPVTVHTTLTVNGSSTNLVFDAGDTLVFVATLDQPLLGRTVTLKDSDSTTILSGFCSAFLFSFFDENLARKKRNLSFYGFFLTKTEPAPIPSVAAPEIAKTICAGTPAIANTGGVTLSSVSVGICIGLLPL